jgi:hypothetical protein
MMLCERAAFRGFLTIKRTANKLLRMVEALLPRLQFSDWLVPTWLRRANRAIRAIR